MKKEFNILQFSLKKGNQLTCNSSHSCHLQKWSLLEIDHGSGHSGSEQGRDFLGSDMETMKSFQVSKEKLGFDSQRFTTVLIVCLIALPVSLMASMMYRNSTFQSSLVPGENAKKSMASGVEIHSPESPIFPTGKLLNGSLEPGINQESDSRNTTSPGPEPTSKNADKLLNGTSNPGLGRESGSRNDSSQVQPPRVADDKLLQGLVPPGIFDEGSCLSRYQSMLYRQPSSNKPSSYLLSKLRNYEDLHKRCGPYSKAYNRAVRRLGARPTFSRSSRGCKYIVWIPANGLGNRMISMAATFLYALLTNRVLLVDHGDDMADLFCEPFPNSSWLLPRNFPLKQLGVLETRRAHSYGKMLKTGIVNMSNDQSLPSHLYLNLDHSDYDLDKKLFYCDESEAPLRKVTWLILLSDQYFSSYFFMSPAYKEEVSKLFPEKNTVFQYLGSYLFNPSNQAWGLITRFYDAYLAKADERIGLQIRVYAKTTPFQTVIDQIFACSLKEKILPEIETQKSVPSHSQSKNKTSKSILIASLYSEFYANLSNMYWTRPTTTDEVIGVFQPSHEEYQHFGNNMHNMKAWAEIYLLSLSDVLVTSAWSTFGYVAQGLGGLKPWILHKTDDNKIPKPPCVRDLSMEPCFHFPPTYDCQAKVKTDAGSLFPYLRHCVDFNHGVKLVTEI